MAPSAVTFDLWHTLVFLAPEDEERYMQRQLEMATELLSASPGLTGRPPSSSDSREAFQAEQRAAIAAAARGESCPVRTQFERASRRLGGSADALEYLDRLRSELLRTPFRPAPGALELLARLRSSGLRIGVISNTIGEPGALLRRLLSRMGFARYVEVWSFSDEHAWTKPSPALFRECLGRLGVPAHRAVHVGDGWMDLEGARRAGCRASVLFTGLQQYSPSYRAFVLETGRHPARADYRIGRLDELPPVLRRAGILQASS